MSSDSEPIIHSQLSQVVEDLGKYFNIRSKSAFINILIDLKENAGTRPANTFSEQLENLNDKPPSHRLG